MDISVQIHEILVLWTHTANIQIKNNTLLVFQESLLFPFCCRLHGMSQWNNIYKKYAFSQFLYFCYMLTSTNKGTYVTFDLGGIRLISLSLIILSYNHFVAYVRISFLRLSKCSTLFMSHFVSFCILAIVHWAAVYSGMHIYFSYAGFISFGYISRTGIAGSILG